MDRGTLPTADEVPSAGERFVQLARLAGGVVVEAIVSSDAPNAAPYVQDHDEWVVVLDGAAELAVDGEVLELSAGEWLLLPAGVPHTVVRTASGTRWLAVHGPVPT